MRAGLFQQLLQRHRHPPGLRGKHWQGVARQRDSGHSGQQVA